MQRIIRDRVYDTEASDIVKKVTFSYYGDPSGYEETLYVTKDGYYFLYTNGGETSKHPVEKIVRKSKKTAMEFVEANR